MLYERVVQIIKGNRKINFQTKLKTTFASFATIKLNFENPHDSSKSMIIMKFFSPLLYYPHIHHYALESNVNI